MEHQKRSTEITLKKYVIWCVVFGIVFALGVSAFVVSLWYKNNFNLEFKELLYTLASPLKGTGQNTVWQILSACLPPALACVLGYVIVTIVFWNCCRETAWLRRTGAAICSLVLVVSLVLGTVWLRIPAYVKALQDKTTVYEDHYVDPEKVAITASGETRNLIYIYVESLETTYTSLELGGAQGINYMPLLTDLAEQNLSFSDKEAGQLGGFHTPLGTGWTMSALLSTTSGIPFSFPLGENGHNKMSQRQTFASGLTTLGDILEEKGYRQEFLCGSDAKFAGRDTYFKQHGSYEIFDLYTARKEGYIPEDYYEFWGYEDEILFKIARDEVRRLAAGDAPFNLTLLTVDLHHVGGYYCDVCENTYNSKLANVVSCTDRQVTEFVEWCRTQDFYEDTTIIITGDHPRMDTQLVSTVEYDDRTIYNCFLNAVPTPAGEVNGRTFTSFDLFPTTLAALGFSIEGERLGFGVNLFSAEATLAETMGYKELETEINKFSDYYIREFS